MLLRKSF